MLITMLPPGVLAAFSSTYTGTYDTYMIPIWAPHDRLERLIWGEVPVSLMINPGEISL